MFRKTQRTSMERWASVIRRVTLILVTVSLSGICGRNCEAQGPPVRLAEPPTPTRTETKEPQTSSVQSTREAQNRRQTVTAAEPVQRQDATTDPTSDREAEKLFALAANQYSLGNWQEAAEGFGRLVEVAPRHPRAVAASFFHGESLVQLGKFAEAHQQFLRYRQLAPTGEFSTQVLFRLGETAFMPGKYEDARKWLERFREDFADHPLMEYTLAYLGDLELHEGHAQKARHYYAQTLRDFPTSALANHCRFGVARSWEMEGNPAEAVRFFEHLVVSNAQNAADALYEIIRIESQHSNHAQVIERTLQFEQRFADSEYATTCRFLRADAHLVRGELGAAREIVEAELASLATAGPKPADDLLPDVTYRVAEALIRDGQVAAGQQLLARIGRTWSDTEWGDDSLETRIAQAYQMQDHAAVDALAAEFSENYAASPLRWRVAEWSGKSLYDRGEYGRAQVELSRAIELLPEGIDDIHPANLNYLLGLACTQTQDWQLAKEALQQSIDLAANEDLELAAILLASTVLRELDEHEPSIAYRREYLMRAPDSPAVADVRLEIVVDLVKRAEWDEAQVSYVEFDQYHRDHSQWSAITRMVAESAYEQQAIELAQIAFARLADFGSTAVDRVDGLTGQAWIRYNAEDYAGAATLLGKALDLTSRGEAAAEAAYLFGRCQQELGFTTEALASYLSVPARDENSKHIRDALLQAARMFRDRGDAESLGQARDTYDPLLHRADCEEIKDVLLYELAWVHMALREDEAANEALRQLIDDHPQSRYWADATYRMAERYSNDGNLEECDRLLDRILAKVTDDDVIDYALYLRGQNEVRRENWAEAALWMDRLRKEYPNSDLIQEASFWVGESTYQLEENDRSREAFVALQEILDPDSAHWGPVIRLRLAQISARQEQWAKALEQAESLAKDAPEFVLAHENDYLQGRCLAAQARFDEARTAYKRVVDSSTVRGSEIAARAQWMIGETYMHQEKFTVAIEAFHHVEVLYPYPKWQSAALLQAGKCHERMGQRDRAIKLYARLLQRFPESEFAGEATERMRAAQSNSAARR